MQVYDPIEHHWSVLQPPMPVALELETVQVDYGIALVIGGSACSSTLGTNQDLIVSPWIP